MGRLTCVLIAVLVVSTLLEYDSLVEAKSSRSKSSGEENEVVVEAAVGAVNVAVDKISSGTIAGIVVGSIILIIVIGGVIYYYCFLE